MDTKEERPGGAFRLAWAVLLLISVALVAAGIALFYMPDALGLGRLVGITVSGVGLFSLFLTWYGVRDQSPLAIRTMWTLPIVLTGAAMAFLLGDRLGWTVICAATAGLAALMLLLARNRIP